MGLIDALTKDTEAVKTNVEEVIRPQAPVLPQEPEKTVDRSAFNCPACGGSGLQDQYTLCSNCNGGGKV